MAKNKHIETTHETKIDFDKFKGDLGFKRKQKITSDRGMRILLNTFKNYARLNNAFEKVTKELKELRENNIGD